MARQGARELKGQHLPWLGHAQNALLMMLALLRGAFNATKLKGLMRARAVLTTLRPHTLANSNTHTRPLANLKGNKCSCISHAHAHKPTPTPCPGMPAHAHKHAYTHAHAHSCTQGHPLPHMLAHACMHPQAPMHANTRPCTPTVVTNLRPCTPMLNQHRYSHAHARPQMLTRDSMRRQTQKWQLGENVNVLCGNLQ